MVIEYRPKRWRRMGEKTSIFYFNYKPFLIFDFYILYWNKIKLIDMKLTGSARLKGKV